MSTAFGYNTRASGNYSFAIGAETKAYGNSSVAMGNNTTARANGDKLSFGLTGRLSPQATDGKLTISAVIIGGSGGEVQATNTIDADKLDHFQQ